MSEHDINLVTSQAGSIVAENQHVTLGTAAGSVTPATVTAMIGINQGTALDLDANVKLAIAKLQVTASSSDYPANVNAQFALNTLTNLHSSLGFGGTPNHAAFGSFLSQAHSHI